MTDRAVTSEADPRIVGAESTGVTKEVTTEIVRMVQGELNERLPSVQIKALRFIPSTRTIIDDSSFQVIANTVIEVARDDRPPRSETLDSVVTVGESGQTQTLQSVMIPALRWSSSG